ncbi:MAG: hypothetical protein EBS05_24525 [Proteobacteria bacterium]|nr:hypothetical protein [Pseudomonadota bacterium]
MTDEMEWIVIFTLAAWFVVTLAYQCFLNRLLQFAFRWDIFRVVPSWHLYTDIPRVRRLYFRDCDATGHVGQWQEIPMRCSRQPWRAIFNPDLFAADALLSLIELLCEAVQRAEPLRPEKIVKTVGWQGIWLQVVVEPSSPGSVARQFEVREETLGAGAGEHSVYASEFLPLTRTKGAI